MSQKRDRTEKEIDAIVVSEADDPTAWEEEAVVKPSRRRVNPDKTHALRRGAAKST
jgi:hypothetical protein